MKFADECKSCIYAYRCLERDRKMRCTDYVDGFGSKDRRSSKDARKDKEKGPALP